jgi:hypothetical protein
MELFRALGALAECPRPELQPIADVLDLGPLPAPAAHGDLFLFQLYPHAAVYLGAEGMLGGEAADRIAGFWRALGQEPPPDPDHLTLLLGLYARLAELENEAAAAGPARDRWRHARAAFLWEHLASWLPLFLAKLSDLAGPPDPAEPPDLADAGGAGASSPVVAPFYGRWGRLLAEALREEAGLLPAPPALPLHLRAAPPLADPRRDGAEAFLGALLAPVRSGIVLTRADLACAARALGIAPRLTDRRAALATLLDQDAAGALGWLAGEAAAWQARHEVGLHLSPALAAFWKARAEATGALLAQVSDL